jgi:hypothetical protein
MCNPNQTSGEFEASSVRICTLTGLLLLFVLLPLAMQLCAQDQPARTTSYDPSEPSPSPSEPAASPLPFMRLVATGAVGLLITAAHLAHSFRRFLGLGVFTNAYTFVLLTLGAGISGIPVTSESTHLGSYLSHNLSPWTLNFLGVMATLVLPAIGRRSKIASSTILDFEGTATSNPLLSSIVDGISERVLRQIKIKLIADCDYTCEEIKRAAHLVVNEETTFQRLTDEQRDSAIKVIDSLNSSSDPVVECDNKYDTLFQLLRWCPFSRLHAALPAVRIRAQISAAKGRAQ